MSLPDHNGFCRKPNSDVYGPKPRMLVVVKCLSVYVGAGRGDLAVSGSSSPEVNMVIWSSSQRCRQTGGRPGTMWSTQVYIYTNEFCVIKFSFIQSWSGDFPAEQLNLNLVGTFYDTELNSVYDQY